MATLNIGIDKIGMYTPPYYVDMVDLAKARDVDPNKYLIGLGQSEMAVTPVSQDVVTMGANAALTFLTDKDRQAIDMVILGTESGIDQSKAGAVYINQLLGIQAYSRSIELKEACYAATAGVQMAVSHIATHPGSKVLVIASDEARYGINTGGEVTQGGGAVAMLISEEPRITKINPQSTMYTQDIMDFWRPNYSTYALVDGQYSNEQYLAFLDSTWTEHKARYRVGIDDYDAFVFHLPYTKMGLKALNHLLPEADESKQAALQEHFEASRVLNKRVGNIYTGSVYLSLLSLLINDDKLEAGNRLGVFSYGSGAVGEFFEMELVEGYREHLLVNQVEQLFANRTKVSVAEYEKIFEEILPSDGSVVELNVENDSSAVVLTGIADHKRQYVLRK